MEDKQTLKFSTRTDVTEYRENVKTKPKKKRNIQFEFPKVIGQKIK